MEKDHGPRKGFRIASTCWIVTILFSDPQVNDEDGENESVSGPIAQLTANVRRTTLQRLLLPTTVVQVFIHFQCLHVDGLSSRTIL